ncbi:hypothetical protein SPJ1_0038 [Streptococcus parauberis KRS-02083]|uniref:Uncharacterized protein n=1 Tax=Streptococcus parauberis KRS-02083 TaxID=1207545 RepID=A0ABN0IT40_9STRE|nr:hypothetical protein SPJ1_0038 [Streptococcus parauberis KRS-02083]
MDKTKSFRFNNYQSYFMISNLPVIMDKLLTIQYNFIIFG